MPAKRPAADAVARMSDLRGTTRVELAERGRAERSVVAREDHAGWEAPASRRDPLEILAESNSARVAELVPIRLGRMMVSPFTYFRGAPAVMASDLASLPATSLWPQICGDAHLSNFGLFGTPERALAFDLNDFDETLPGPFEWDLKRLTASFVVAARTIGLGDEAGRIAAGMSVRRYAEAMRTLSDETTLDVWYTHVRSDDLEELAKDSAVRRRLEKGFAKARTRTSLQAFNKLTAVVDGHRVIVDDPPLIMHIAEASDEGIVHRFWEEYLTSVSADVQHLLHQYEMVDVAMKVVGVGSVGTRCFVALLEGRAELDPLLLQVKEAAPSVLEPYLGHSAFENHGERVVVGQRLMQAASDLFLGWSTGPYGRSFFVRQLRDMKFSADLEAGASTTFFERYAEACGATLARAHAKSCDPALISAYVGGGKVLAKALVKWGAAYADQTERDHAQLVEAARSGQVEVVEGR